MVLDVVVVDDEAAIGEILVDVLGQEGYRVGWATTAHDGLRQIAQGRPRLVLSDVMLPGMGGVELAARIGGLEGDGGPRCILMSAAPPPIGLPDWVPFLRKPFDLEIMLQMVRGELARAGVTADRRHASASSG